LPGKSHRTEVHSGGCDAVDAVDAVGDGCGGDGWGSSVPHRGDSRDTLSSGCRTHRGNIIETV
jgi:hypothetical protein